MVLISLSPGPGGGVLAAAPFLNCFLPLGFFPAWSALALGFPLRSLKPLRPSPESPLARRTSA